MKSKCLLVPIALVALASLGGCSRAKADPAAAASAAASPAGVATASAPVVSQAVTLNSGTTVPVRLEQTLDTQRNRSGDRFTASLDEPLVSGDRVIVPKGTMFFGHVTEAKPSGRFRGRGVMVLTLDSFDLRGQNYPIQVASSSRATGGHKKRNWLWMGGGSGGGALIGAAAGGGVGAAIGAGAGAGAGFIGAVVTGKKQVVLPVESRVIFKLRTPVQIGG